jgi:hypothetical protein
MNPIFDLWGEYMVDLQMLWFIALPVVLIGAGIASRFKRADKK